MSDDLRSWLAKVEAMGELERIDGADWDLEIGALADLNRKRQPQPQALLFDNIKGYPQGFRLLAGSLASPARTALSMGFPQETTALERIAIMRQRLVEVEKMAPEFAPKVVKTGPILENVMEGEELNLQMFPTPKWHELDGSRYIGTGDAVIMRDPDTGEINVGTYRVAIHDDKEACIYISPGKDGRIYRDRYFERGEPCPAAVSLGHDPLFFIISALTGVPRGMEYGYYGAMRGEPAQVVIDEVTGLPIPADSELVFTGWVLPDKQRPEGPFGEWTGYYASKQRAEPVFKVERVYYRNTPIILGSPPMRPPSDHAYCSNIIRSALLHNELERAGVPDVRGVWFSEAGIHTLIIVSIKQRYAGHARQAGFLTSQMRAGAAYAGRYVVVVDEDIDPTDVTDVLWAICFRSDPDKDIDIIRRAWSTPLDPLIRKPAEAYFNSRAVIDATKPFEWINEFPPAITIDPETRAKVKARWGI